MSSGHTALYVLAEWVGFQPTVWNLSILTKQNSLFNWGHSIDSLCKLCKHRIFICWFISSKESSSEGTNHLKFPWISDTLYIGLPILVKIGWKLKEEFVNNQTWSLPYASDGGDCKDAGMQTGLQTKFWLDHATLITPLCIPTTFSNQTSKTKKLLNIMMCVTCIIIDDAALCACVMLCLLAWFWVAIGLLFTPCSLSGCDSRYYTLSISCFQELPLLYTTSWPHVDTVSAGINIRTW